MSQKSFCSSVKIKFTLRSKCFLPVTGNCWHLCKYDSRSEIKKSFLIILLSSVLLYHVDIKPKIDRQVHTQNQRLNKGNCISYLEATWNALSLLCPSSTTSTQRGKYVQNSFFIWSAMVLHMKCYILDICTLLEIFGHSMLIMAK